MKQYYTSRSHLSYCLWPLCGQRAASPWTFNYEHIINVADKAQAAGDAPGRGVAAEVLSRGPHDRATKTLAHFPVGNFLSPALQARPVLSALVVRPTASLCVFCPTQLCYFLVHLCCLPT